VPVPIWFSTLRPGDRPSFEVIPNCASESIAFRPWAAGHVRLTSLVFLDLMTPGRSASKHRGTTDDAKAHIQG
jgi:hypothetical protein